MRAPPPAGCGTVIHIILNPAVWQRTSEIEHCDVLGRPKFRRSCLAFDVRVADYNVEYGVVRDSVFSGLAAIRFVQAINGSVRKSRAPDEFELPVRCR